MASVESTVLSMHYLGTGVALNSRRMRPSGVVSGPSLVMAVIKLGPVLNIMFVKGSRFSDSALLLQPLSFKG